MEFIDQNSTELRLSLTNSSFDKESLSVIVSREVKENGYSIEYGILGASHFVSIKKGDVDFTEVFACVELEKTESIKLNKSIILEKTSESFKYLFKADVVPFQTDKEIITRNLELKDLNKGLVFEFPSEKEGLFQALTIIFIYFVKTGVKIETIHAYPNENNVVKTTSFLEII